MHNLLRKNDNKPEAEIVARLSDLGLNNYESHAYFTLLNEGISTAKDISNITGVPYGKIYEIINSLATKGFVQIIPSKPMKCRPIEPMKAFEKVKEGVNVRMSDLSKFVIGNLVPRYSGSKEMMDSRGDFFILSGRSHINHKIEELMEDTAKQIFIHTTENGLKRLVAMKSALDEAANRGVKIKVAAPLTDGNQEDLESLQTCCEIVDSDHPDSVVFTFDSKHCIMSEPIPDNENYISGRDHGLHAHNPAFAKYMEGNIKKK